MVESQSFVVEVDSFIVRFPLPDKVQVQKAQDEHDFDSEVLQRFQQCVQHENQFYQKVEHKVEQNVPRFVIGSIGVVFIMLQLFVNGLGDSGLLLICES